MPLSLVPLNSNQKSQLQIAKEGRVVNANTGLYTVPANTETEVTSITGLIDALGADASYAVAIKRGVNFRPVGEMVVTNKISKFEGSMLLQAGDIITNVGDSGSTNGTVDMVASIREYAI